MNKPIKLTIVDDDHIFRSILLKYLKPYKNIEIISHMSNGEELLNSLKEQSKPDVILLDLEMPVMNGLDVIDILSFCYPKIRILVLTAHIDERTSHGLISKGVHGFLNKHNVNRLAEAIKSVYEFNYYFTNMNLSKVFSYKDESRDTNRMVNFTKRELEILKLICKQLTNKEISEKLFISPRTVDRHRDTLLQKTNSSNVVGLALYAAQYRLI